MLIYYGTTETGKYFQTVPLDPNNPKSRNVTRPDRELPLDPTAQGTVREVDPSKRDNDLYQTCTLAVHPVGFNIALRQIYATSEQECSSDVYQHWVYSRFDRSEPPGWVAYNYPVASTRSDDNGWYEFFFEEGCSVGAGGFIYRQNATGQAETDDGRIITSEPTESDGTPGDCGPGVTP